MSTKKWFQAKVDQSLGRTSDLNPLENLWNDTRRGMQMRLHQGWAKSLQSLFTSVRNVYNVYHKSIQFL